MNTFTAKKLSFKEIQMAKPIYILYFISSSPRIKDKLNYKITYGSHYNKSPDFKELKQNITN